MSERFYSHARLYDRLFPGSEPAIDFYKAEADRQGGSVLELGCGTGHKLIPIASDGHPCTGVELSSYMLTEAQLADADGVRRTRDALSFVDPDRGNVRVDVAETHDASSQVTRGRWHFSADCEPDFVVAPLELRSIFPQELPLLLSLGGLRLVERFGDWSGRPLTGDAAIQLCVCESD